MTSRRLSALDASFLYGEDQRIPLHVGCLGLMDAAPLRDPQGGVDIARLRAGIQQRLHRVPPFRQRLLEVPLDQGRPLWVDDAAFRIENHVHLTALPGPGTRRQLLDLMGRLQSRLLDRTRPLWELYFVDGLGGGRGDRAHQQGPPRHHRWHLGRRAGHPALRPHPGSPGPRGARLGARAGARPGRPAVRRAGRSRQRRRAALPRAGRVAA